MVIELYQEMDGNRFKYDKSTEDFLFSMCEDCIFWNMIFILVNNLNCFLIFPVIFEIGNDICIYSHSII